MMASSLLRNMEFNQNKIKISFISKFPTHWMSLRGMPFNQRNFFVPSFIKRARNSFFVTKYPESYQSNTIQSWKEKWEINLTKAERTSEENYLPWQWKKHSCIQQEHDKHKICVSPSLPGFVVTNNSPAVRSCSNPPNTTLCCTLYCRLDRVIHSNCQCPGAHVTAW